jgi:hypothetical protein
MVKDITYIFIILVIIFGSFILLDNFNINLNKESTKRLVKTINLET